MNIYEVYLLEPPKKNRGKHGKVLIVKAKDANEAKEKALRHSHGLEMTVDEVREITTDVFSARHY